MKKIRKTLFLSFAIKFSVVVLCASLVLFRYVVGERKQNIWFDPTATNDDVSRAIRASKDIDARDEKGLTGLMRAASEIQLDRVRLFVENGANINAQDLNNGNTPLHWACFNGQARGARDVIDFLVTSGASVRIKNNDGDTPLHTAVQIGNFDVMKHIILLFVINGADPNAVNNKGMTILHILAQNNNQVLVRKILEQFGSFFSDRTLYSAADYANSLGFNLIAKEFDVPVIDLPREKDGNGLSALMLAIIRHDKNAVERLTSLGADLSAQSEEYGYNSLHIAIAQQQVGILELLIKNMGNVNNPIERGDRFGDKPIHIVSRLELPSERRRAVQLLVENGGANVNAKNSKGNTLLHLVARSNELDLADYLITHFKVDASVRNVDGDRAVDIARRLGFKEMVALLQR
jgi:ankyrin repeat protein